MAACEKRTEALELTVASLARELAHTRRELKRARTTTRHILAAAARDGSSSPFYSLSLELVEVITTFLEPDDEFFAALTCKVLRAAVERCVAARGGRISTRYSVVCCSVDRFRFAIDELGLDPHVLFRQVMLTPGDSQADQIERLDWLAFEEAEALSDLTEKRCVDQPTNHEKCPWVVAAIGGRIDVLSWLDEHYIPWSAQRCRRAYFGAIFMGNDSVAEWMGKKYGEVNCELEAAIVSGGRWRPVVVPEDLSEVWETFELAIMAGNLALATTLSTHISVEDGEESLMELACVSGNLELIQFVDEWLSQLHRSPLCCYYAAVHGHIGALNWLRITGFDWPPPKACMRAELRRKKHFDILAMVIAEGCPPDLFENLADADRDTLGYISMLNNPSQNMLSNDIADLVLRSEYAVCGVDFPRGF